MKNKKKNIEISFCPKQPIGNILWINWIHRHKCGVENKLNEKFNSWQEEGFKIVKVEIREIK